MAKRKSIQTAEAAAGSVPDKNLKPMSVEMMQAFFNAFPYSVAICDSVGRILFTNQFFSDKVKNDIIGDFVYNSGLYKGDSLLTLTETAFPTAAEGRPWEGMLTITLHGGLTEERFHRLTPLLTESGDEYVALTIERSDFVDNVIRSERRFRSMFDNAAEGIMAADTGSRRFVYVNPAACQMFGYEEEKFLKIGIQDIHPQEDFNWISEQFNSLARGEIDKVADLPCIRRDGSRFYASLVSRSMTIDGILCNLGFFTDRTEQHETEERLKESEERYRSLFEAASEGIIVAGDGDKRQIKLANVAACAMFGYTESELTNLWVDDLHPNVAFRGILEEFEAQDRGERILAQDIPCVRKEGTVFHSEIGTTKVSFGGVAHRLILVRDISEFKAVRDSLEENRERLKAIVENTPNVAIEGFDIEGRVLYWNQAAENLFGWSEKEVLGKTLDQSILDENSVKEFLATLQEINNTNLPAGPMEWDCIRKDGNTRSVFSTIFPIFSSGGDREFVCMDVDITERKRAEAELSKTGLFLSSVLNSIQDGISVVDEHLNVQMVNGVMNKWYSENIPIEGKKCYECYHNTKSPCDPCPSIKAMKTGITEVDIVPGLPGSPVEWVELYSFPMKDPVSGKVTGVVEYVRDITERRRVENELEKYRRHLEDIVEARTAELKEAHERLIAAERMAVMGRFAGSIAHEIRNPLGAIANASYYLKRKIASGDPKVNHFLDVIDKRVNDTTRIIESILNLTRMESPRKSKVNICDVLKMVVESSEIPISVTVEWVCPEDGIEVSADSEQIRIALKNIVRNALQAMTGVGTISITAKRAGAWAEVTVRDTGLGIDENNFDSIFQPLFTTKAYGIGLGLPIVKLIVEKHGGDISVASEPGIGSAFTMRLPVDK